LGYLGNKPTAVPIQSSDLQDNIITSAKIANGAITGDDINSTFNIGSKTVTLPSASVTSHVTATDLQPIKSDLTALAIREATNEASAAFNLPSSFIETFTDDTNLGTQTTGDRVSGYWATVYTTPPAVFDYGGVASADRAKLWRLGFASGTNSTWFTVGDGTDTNNEEKVWNASGTTDVTGYHSNGTGSTSNYYIIMDYTNQLLFSDKLKVGKAAYWGDPKTWRVQYSTDNITYTDIDFTGITQSSYYDGGAGTGGQLVAASGTSGGLFTVAASTGGNTFRSWTLIQGMPTFTARYLKYFNTATWGGANNNMGHCDFVPYVKTAVASATGTLIQSANAVTGTRTTVGGTMLYKDNAGTATLGTDLKIYFTANGGSNWTEAAGYTAITPVYSTGIKQVRLTETTVTGGTDVRYKAVYANQAASSKETQLHAIGINY